MDPFRSAPRKACAPSIGESAAVIAEHLLDFLGKFPGFADKATVEIFDVLKHLSVGCSPVDKLLIVVCFHFDTHPCLRNSPAMSGGVQPSGLRDLPSARRIGFPSGPSFAMFAA